MSRLEGALGASIAVLAMIASAAGLLLPNLYRDPAAIRPAMQGQDLVTLIVAPVVFVSVWLASQGSPRARVLALGFVGYIAYTYAGAAFGYRFNPMLLVYVALLALSVAALVVLARGVDPDQVHAAFGHQIPRRLVAIYLAMIALMLGAIELTEISRYLVTGVVPAAVVNAGDATFFPYVLDLGFVVPLSTIAAWWVWRARPIGDVLAGVLLIKAATMGLALVAMDVVSILSGRSSDGLMPFYAFIAAGALTLSWMCFRTSSSPNERAEKSARKSTVTS